MPQRGAEFQFSRAAAARPLHVCQLLRESASVRAGPFSVLLLVRGSLSHAEESLLGSIYSVGKRDSIAGHACILLSTSAWVLCSSGSLHESKYCHSIGALTLLGIHQICQCSPRLHEGPQQPSFAGFDRMIHSPGFHPAWFLGIRTHTCHKCKDSVIFRQLLEYSRVYRPVNMYVRQTFGASACPEGA